MYPLIVCTSVERIPERLWNQMRFNVVPDLPKVHPTQACPRCGKPIGAHSWYVLTSETDVTDCSESPMPEED